MYNVVFKTLQGQNTGAITWTSFKNKRAFAKWWSDKKMRKWFEVVAKNLPKENILKVFSPTTDVLNCDEAKEKIDFFFSSPTVAGIGKEQIQAWQEALQHMTFGTLVGRHKISCLSCWEYYEAKKREYCGG